MDKNLKKGFFSLGVAVAMSLVGAASTIGAVTFFTKEGITSVSTCTFIAIAFASIPLIIRNGVESAIYYSKAE